MVQVLSQKGNIFGQIGRGVGQGLSEQVPKEIERYRLASGLKDLSEQKDLTPFQQFAGLVGIPGAVDRPQVIQSGAELLKQQQIRNAYKNNAESSQTPTGNSPSIQDVKFGQAQNQIERPQRMAQSQQGQTIPSDFASRGAEAAANQPAASENPLSGEYIPASPWNKQRDDQAVNEAFEKGVATNFPEARAYADRQKELYENAPQKFRDQLDYKKGIDLQTDDLFDKHLQTRLQKEGKETYGDVPGDLQLNIKKMARNAVATGKMTPVEAAEYYSKKALDLTKDKGEVIQIANRDVFDRLLPHKKDETLKSLMHVSKNYADMGSSEDYYNLLRTDQLDSEGKQLGMGLSPGGASIIAYPRTEKVKNLIRNTKISPKNPSESTRDFAQNLFKEMTPKDSFLAIARQMKQQDPNFDEYSFFDYLRENQDQYGSNPRLNREVTQGVSDFFPNWRDIGLFPAFSKPVTND